MDIINNYKQQRNSLNLLEVKSYADRMCQKLEEFEKLSELTSQLKGLADSATNFEREERYLVIKISKLSDDHKTRRAKVAAITDMFSEAFVDCVVVEADWPEYEPTWQAIKARVNGVLQKLPQNWKEGDSTPAQQDKPEDLSEVKIKLKLAESRERLLRYECEKVYEANMKFASVMEDLVFQRDDALEKLEELQAKITEQPTAVLGELPDSVIDAAAVVLGDAYVDLHGRMAFGDDKREPIAGNHARLSEIAQAIISAYRTALQPAQSETVTQQKSPSLSTIKKRKGWISVIERLLSFGVPANVRRSAESVIKEINDSLIYGRAAQPAAVSEGWKEAAIAWEVCASIHREYAKGSDALFKTRQADFVRHADKARGHAGHVAAQGEQQ